MTRHDSSTLVDVDTNSGIVRGVLERDVATFRGVPYGAPPTDGLRFAPPVPPQAWPGPRPCLFWGPIAPQRSWDQQHLGRANNETAYILYRGSDGVAQDEDCLRLNIWTPDTDGSRPVFVYLHGGGFAEGSGNHLLAYDGANLAKRHDVVVVNGNHRLNLFGFLDVSRVLPGFQDAANLGMQDLVLLLRWVRDNVAAFGGDPSNVTICGQSGGGVKVACLMAMPSARGLFHRAIIQSGSLTRLLSPEDADSQARAVLDQHGWDAGDLRRLPVEELLNAVNPEKALEWWPVLDRRVITEHLLGHPDAPGAEAMSAVVPVIIGTNRAEFMQAVDNPRAQSYSEGDLLRDIADDLGDRAHDAIEAYRALYPRASPFQLSAAIRTAPLRAAAVAQLDQKTAQQGAGWSYIFDWDTPVLGGSLGVFHSAEIPFVHDNAGLCTRQTGGGDDALRVAHEMSTYWTAFARDGMPASDGLPQWDPWGADRPTIVFGNSTRCRAHFDDAALAATAALSLDL
jgi:para-nitrobenzyl esterase